MPRTRSVPRDLRLVRKRGTKHYGLRPTRRTRKQLGFLGTRSAAYEEIATTGADGLVVSPNKGAVDAIHVFENVLRACTRLYRNKQLRTEIDKSTRVTYSNGEGVILSSASPRREGLAVTYLRGLSVGHANARGNG